MKMRQGRLFNQRWRERHDSYRPAGEVIRPSEYEVARIPDDKTAKDFVVFHHYAATYPAARFRYGLYRHGRLVGVAVYGHPCQDRILTDLFPGKATDSTELSRFILLDEVPGNGETWFLARTFEFLRREHQIGVLSFSDPMPRTTLEGRTIFFGHLGTIYQAKGACYLGRGDARPLRLLPDGRVLHNRAISKIRNQERGWQTVARILEHYGADPVGKDDPREWLSTWLNRLTRRARHPGNYKYAWALDRRIQDCLPPSLPYPKRLAS